jgi:hypothetical protein
MEKLYGRLAGKQDPNAESEAVRWEADTEKS